MGVYTEEVDVATDAPVFATVMDDGREVRWTLWTRAGADDAVTVLASGEADSVSEGFALAREQASAPCDWTSSAREVRP